MFFILCFIFGHFIVVVVEESVNDERFTGLTILAL